MAGTKEILPKGGTAAVKPAPAPGATLPRSGALQDSAMQKQPPSPAAAAPKKPKLSLTWKIFLGTAAVVTTVLGLTLLFTNLSAKRAADQAIDRGLAATSSQVQAFLDGRERGLLVGARVFVKPAPFFSLFEAAEIKREDMLDQAGEAVTQIVAEWVQITDAGGMRLAKSNEPSAPADSLGASALIGGALEGREVTGVGLTGDSIVYQAVAVPVRNATSVVGVLMATRMIDSLLADSIKRATDSDIVFYALDTLDKPHIAASTLPKSAALTRFLAERLTTRAAVAEAAESSSAARDSAGLDSVATVAARDELQLGETHYVGQGAPLLSASGTPLGGFVALRSRD
jgi:eukaryotic-like serine/threonine-protein kinase